MASKSGVTVSENLASRGVRSGMDASYYANAMRLVDASFNAVAAQKSAYYQNLIGMLGQIGNTIAQGFQAWGDYRQAQDQLILEREIRAKEAEFRDRELALKVMQIEQANVLQSMQVQEAQERLAAAKTVRDHKEARYLARVSLDDQQKKLRAYMATAGDGYINADEVEALKAAFKTYQAEYMTYSMLPGEPDKTDEMLGMAFQEVQAFVKKQGVLSASHDRFGEFTLPRTGVIEALDRLPSSDRAMAAGALLKTPAAFAALTEEAQTYVKELDAAFRGVATPTSAAVKNSYGSLSLAEQQKIADDYLANTMSPERVAAAWQQAYNATGSEAPYATLSAEFRKALGAPAFSAITPGGIPRDGENRLRRMADTSQTGNGDPAVGIWELLDGVGVDRATREAMRTAIGMGLPIDKYTERVSREPPKTPEDYVRLAGMFGIDGGGSNVTEAPPAAADVLRAALEGEPRNQLVAFLREGRRGETPEEVRARGHAMVALVNLSQAQEVPQKMAADLLAAVELYKHTNPGSSVLDDFHAAAKRIVEAQTAGVADVSAYLKAPRDGAPLDASAARGKQLVERVNAAFPRYLRAVEAAAADTATRVLRGGYVVGDTGIREFARESDSHLTTRYTRAIQNGWGFREGSAARLERGDPSQEIGSSMLLAQTGAYSPERASGIARGVSRVASAGAGALVRSGTQPSLDQQRAAARDLQDAWLATAIERLDAADYPQVVEAIRQFGIVRQVTGTLSGVRDANNLDPATLYKVAYLSSALGYENANVFADSLAVLRSTLPVSPARVADRANLPYVARPLVEPLPPPPPGSPVATVPVAAP